MHPYLKLGTDHEHMEMRAQYKIRSPHLTNVPEAFNYSPRITTSLQTDRQTERRTQDRDVDYT